MAVYRARPARAAAINDPDHGVSATADQIICPEEDGQDTGLLDMQGNRLFRYRDPVGYRVPRA